MYSKEETLLEINYYTRNFNLMLLKLLNTITLLTQSVMYCTQYFNISVTVGVHIRIYCCKMFTN